jgi:hypothetical protein
MLVFFFELFSQDYKFETWFEKNKIMNFYLKVILKSFHF